MTRITIPIPALTGGVSTQPEPTRLPQQAQLSDNTIGTVIEGLRKRPPTEHLDILPILYPGVQQDIHLQEGEFLMHTDGVNELRVWDISSGAEKVVLGRTGTPISVANLSYLNCSNPRDSLRFLTLSDYTLILNREVTVRESTTLTESSPNQALVHILQGAYRAHYTVTVSHQRGDHISVTFETHGSDGAPPGTNTPGTVGIAETSVQTNTIASEIAGYLWNNTSPSGIVGGSVQAGLQGLQSTGNWHVDVESSTLRIWRLDGTDFDVAIEESVGSSSMALVYKQAQLFSDLPETAPNGMAVEIVGDQDTAKSTYWVRFHTHDTSLAPNAWGSGYWEESVKPSISIGVDPNTMPHALIRQSDGRWRFTPLSGISYIVSGSQVDLPIWEPRPAGDEITNPSPDCVGGTLKSLCFHEGRLGILSESSLILSEVREPFNLYRTSVVDVVDSERITLKAPSQKSETLQHAIPFGGDIVLFTEQNQYLVRSNGPYTPSSVSMVAAGGHDSDPVAEPVQVRGLLFVPREVGGAGAVSALQVVGDQRPKLDSIDITASVPGYLEIPHKILTTPQLDMVCAYSEGSSDLWVYTEFFNGGEKVHQAWQRFTFEHADAITHAWFRETTLYLVVTVGDEHHLWKLRLQPGATDYGEPVVFLDRRVSSSDLVDPSLSSGDTVYTLPYDTTSGDGLVAMLHTSRKAVRILNQVGPLVTVAGDTTETPIWFGYPFQFRHDLSRTVLLDKDRVPVSTGILRLEQGTVCYDRSGPFEVVIMDERGGESIHKFSGSYLGQGAHYQKMLLTSGKLPFPIRDRSDEVRVSFRSSSSEAVRLVSLDINARMARQGQRTRA